jgi:hypothetical protein
VAKSRAPKAPREPEGAVNARHDAPGPATGSGLNTGHEGGGAVLGGLAGACRHAPQLEQEGRGATPHPPADPGPGGTGIALSSHMMEDSCSGLQRGLLNEAPSLSISRRIALTSEELLWLT